MRQWTGSALVQVACSASSHYLNQCWLIVNWTSQNKFHWSSNHNSIIFIQEMHLKFSSVKMAAICPKGDALNLLMHNPVSLNFYMPHNYHSYKSQLWIWVHCFNHPKAPVLQLFNSTNCKNQIAYASIIYSETVKCFPIDLYKYIIHLNRMSNEMFAFIKNQITELWSVKNVLYFLGGSRPIEEQLVPKRWKYQRCLFRMT